MEEMQGEEGEEGQSPCHLQGVVQSGAGRVQREVLEGLDSGLAPALLLVPFHHQHVVGECLPEQQGLAGVGSTLYLKLCREERREIEL